jgi:hypothetical protein
MSHDALEGDDEIETSACVDGLGNPVPSSLADAFRRGPEFGEAIKLLRRLKRWLIRTRGGPAGLVIQESYTRIAADLDNLISEIKFARPFTVCVYCDNELPAFMACGACRQRGFISEEVFRAAPAELRAKRESPPS